MAIYTVRNTLPHGITTSEGIGTDIHAGRIASASLASANQASCSRTSTFRERKIDHLERHLRDYKKAIINAAQSWRSPRGCLLIDDYYLITREWQPDVVDYLHRLLRDTNVYLKVATIRHRTRLLRNHPQTVGVELSQDVEEINLDRTLEDLDETRDFLGRMLKQMGESVGARDVEQLFNPDAMQALTLASGGVPRDFLTLFVHAVDIAAADGKPRWITPTYVYKGASRMSYQTKLRHLREDAYGDASGLERVLVDLITFCLKEKRKTGFLISQDESQRFTREHDIVQQLMDFKLIHVVEPDTSAASSRSGRYEAYTLDFSIFMEPRRRGIEIVEFWKRGDDRHRIGVRELPTYPLERVQRAFDDLSSKVDVESFLAEQERTAEVENTEVERVAPNAAIQGSLFSKEGDKSNA